MGVSDRSLRCWSFCGLWFFGRISGGRPGIRELRLSGLRVSGHRVGIGNWGSFWGLGKAHYGVSGVCGLKT